MIGSRPSSNSPANCLARPSRERGHLCAVRMTLDEILTRLGALPESNKKQVKAEALKATAKRYFVPNVGPQTEAYFSQADEVFYGGGAGGGKSALLCGLAIESAGSSSSS